MTNHAVVAFHGQRIGRLIALFVLLFVAFILTVDMLTLWAAGGTFVSKNNLYFVIALTMTVGACGFFQYLRLSGPGERVANALGGTRVAFLPKSKSRQQYENIVSELAIAAGIPAPKLFVLTRDSGINTFAAGSLELGTAIAVTQGALEKLTRSELQGLVAHEMAHLRHGDAAQGRWLAAGVFGLLCFMLVGGATLLLAGQAAGSGSKEGLGGMVLLGVIGLVVAILGLAGWVAASILDAAASREMEYRADADAVRMVSDSEGLVGVLIKIGQESNEFPSDFKGLMNAVTPMFFRSGAKGYWFHSHPPLFDRILALDPAKAAELQRMMGD